MRYQLTDRIETRRSRSGLRCAALGLILICLVWRAHEPIAGQTARPRPSSWAAPRTPWGDPDLQGLWTNTTAIPLERPDELGGKAELTDEEIEEQRIAAQLSRSEFMGQFFDDENRPSKRTSGIIDPPNGKIPELTPEAQKRFDARQAYLKLHPMDAAQDRNLYERCLTRGLPGSMTTGFYNHNYQIFQTPGVVAIHLEMIHDTRIIYTGRPHLESKVRQWMGDSRGRWEGNTLVVETTNFTDKGEFRGPSRRGQVYGENLRMVERFTRTGPDTIDYRFTIEDPTTFTRPWTAWIPMRALDGMIYEYACHEGNYALPLVLSGARAEEKAAEVARKKSR